MCFSAPSLCHTQWMHNTVAWNAYIIATGSSMDAAMTDLDLNLLGALDVLLSEGSVTGAAG